MILERMGSANEGWVLGTGFFGYHASSSKHRALSFHAIGTREMIVHDFSRYLPFHAFGSREPIGHALNRDFWEYRFVRLERKEW